MSIYIILKAAMGKEFSHVIGIDEVGTGAIAGPIVVAGAVVPWGYLDAKLKDSKRFSTDKSRIAGAEYAKNVVCDYAVVAESSRDIELRGPNVSLQFAQWAVAKSLIEKYPAALVVVDGNKKIPNIPVQLTIVGADAKVPAVSAASIIAKVFRDSIMMRDPHLDYEFYKNKGYPTPEHLRLLQELGPLDGMHRSNTEPVMNLKGKT